MTRLWWLLALVGYFGPWSGQRAAALAWNAYDLFDVLRVLPQIESGTLQIHLHTLRLPLLGLGILLPLLFAETRPILRWGAGLMGGALALLTLPPYPHIVTAWRTPGWNVAWWWALGGAVGCGLAALLAPRLGLFRRWLIIAGALATGVPASITLTRLLPALETLYAHPVRAGWGFWLWSTMLVLLIVTLLWQRKETPAMKQPATQEMKTIRTVKAHYEASLLRKANVVGVGIGQRQITEAVYETVLVVNVTHKVSSEMLAPEDRIPKEIEGIPVDVLPVGKLTGE